MKKSKAMVLAEPKFNEWLRKRKKMLKQSGSPRWVKTIVRQYKREYALRKSI